MLKHVNTVGIEWWNLS